MATNTTPDNLLKPQSTDQIAPLETVLGNMQDSVQTALTNRNKQMFLMFATAAAMNAAPGTQIGQHAFVYNDSTVANNGDYVWSGTAWVAPSPVTPYGFVASMTGAQSVSGGWALLTAYATPDISRGFTLASGVLTVQQAGWYDISAAFFTPSQGVQSFLITKNSAVVTAGVLMQIQVSGLSAYGAKPVYLVPNDQLRMFGAAPASNQPVTSASFLSVTFKSVR